MFHLAGKIFLVLSFISFLGSTRSFAETRDVIEGLDLEKYSEKQVKGCYYYNNTLGICFDVQQHSMRLLKTTGENIFVDQDLYPDSFFYQVLDQAFLGIDGMMVYIPKDVPRTREELLGYMALLKASPPEQRLTEVLETTKAHYEEAMTELHYTPEIQLLELLQEALMDNSTQLEILKPFYTLSLHLLSSSNVQAPAELKAELGLHDHHRQKRCLDLRKDPYGNNCQGMCGPRCWCWRRVCGDCCWNRGCYEHDRCCEAKGYWHEYCRRPFKHSFNCNSYGAYPRCLF